MKNTLDHVITEEEAIQQLEVFVGKWQTDGEILSPEGNQLISGTDTYEWLPGNHFLLHHVDVVMGKQKVKSVEIIGFDSGNQCFFMESYDNDGNKVSMIAIQNNGIWNFLGKDARFSGEACDDGNAFSGLWEKLNEDGHWVPWMEIKLTKQLLKEEN